jgi:hypothetical protein
MLGLTVGDSCHCSCRYGYTSATFFLDDGTQFTCGKGNADYKPPGYDKWGGAYNSYGYKQGSSYTKGRRLQAFSSKGGWGGWSRWAAALLGVHSSYSACSL